MPSWYPLAWGSRGFCLAVEWNCRSRRFRFLGAGAINQPSHLWRLGVEFTDEMKFIGDQALDFVSVVVEPREVLAAASIRN
jgi:hypothetical protein